jgi:uncharacterized protein
VQLGLIQIFPIKSLDGVLVDQAAITPGGILQNDRVYAIFDRDGRVVNGKRTARIHDLRSEFDPGFREVRLWSAASPAPAQFSLDPPALLEQWLGEFFGFPVELKFEPLKGFPDDRDAFGPTIVSEASLREVQSWFPELPLESVRRRFRANLELLHTEPFGEDRLFGAPDTRQPFQIGAVNFLGHNPCQRCVVPTRDPDSGRPVTDFQKKFMERRKQTLPAWADSRRFNHFYRFTVNTSIPRTEAGKILRAGDIVAY